MRGVMAPEGSCVPGAVRVYNSGDERIVYLVLKHGGSSGVNATGKLGRSYVLHSTSKWHTVDSFEEHDEHAIWFVESEDYA